MLPIIFSKKIFASGTPYETKTLQFYPCLHILSPQQFNNEYKFKMRYCDPVKTFFGWKFEGLSNFKKVTDENYKDFLIEIEHNKNNHI